MSSPTTWRRALLSSLCFSHQFLVVSKAAINYPVLSWPIGMGSLCHLCSEDIAPFSSQEFPVVLQAGQRTGTFPITAGFFLLIRFVCLWLTQPVLQRFHLPQNKNPGYTGYSRKAVSCLLPSHSPIAEPAYSYECKQANTSAAIRL